MRKILFTLLFVILAFLSSAQSIDSNYSVPSIIIVNDTVTHTVYTHRVESACNTCASPCGSINYYTSAPFSFNNETPHYAQIPPIAANNTSPTQCFTFEANNTSENINMGSAFVGGFGCGYSLFNWTIYNSSCTSVASGTLFSLTVNGLTCGQHYTICLSFKSNCEVDTIAPYVYHSSCATLPIKLLNFDVDYNQDNHYVYCGWATATEIDNKYFTIQKSQNGVNWDKVQYVNSKAIDGNSDQPLYYSTIDTTPYIGLSYYRLLQTDLDGQMTTFSPVSIEVIDEIIKVYPNPITNTLNIEYDNPQSKVVYAYITDILGKSLYSNTFDFKAGNNLIQLDMSIISKGTYIVTIDGNHFKLVK